MVDMSVACNSAERLLQDLKGRSLAWDAAFEVSTNNDDFIHMVDMVSADTDDIFTAKLSQTRAFFNSVKTGQVAMLIAPGLVPNFSAALSVLTIILTHNRLSRTGIAPMRAPGYWITSRGQSRSSSVIKFDPIMPVSQLQTITGFSEAQLKLCISPLVRDNAIQVVRNAEGVVGVAVVEGISNEGPTRRFMRH